MEFLFFIFVYSTLPFLFFTFLNLFFFLLPLFPFLSASDAWLNNRDLANHRCPRGRQCAKEDNINKYNNSITAPEMTNSFSSLFIFLFFIIIHFYSPFLFAFSFLPFPLFLFINPWSIFSLFLFFLSPFFSLYLPSFRSLVAVFVRTLFGLVSPLCLFPHRKEGSGFEGGRGVGGCWSLLLGGFCAPSRPQNGGGMSPFIGGPSFCLFLCFIIFYMFLFNKHLLLSFRKVTNYLNFSRSLFLQNGKVSRNIHRASYCR